MNTYVPRNDATTATNAARACNKVRVRAAARTRTLLQALAALVAVVASFLGTYVFIAVFPKHR